MTEQLNQTISAQVILPQQEEEELKRFVLSSRDQGYRAREKYEKHWKDCERAYHCQVDPPVDEEMEWQSNLCLPWAFDAVEAWYAHQHATLIPKDDDIFSITGVMDDDAPGAKVMDEYCEYRFNKNGFPERFGQSFRQLAIKNHTCLKVYWKKNETIEYKWEPYQQLDPMTGDHVQGWQQNQKTNSDFNNVHIDVVDLDNFVMFPIYGEFEKTTRIHTTYRYYEELMTEAAAGKTPYFNLDQLKPEDDVKAYMPDGSALDVKSIPDAKNFKYSGLKITEAWISRVKIGEKVYQNYVATIVNDRVLIRFEPNPCPGGKSPFIWMPLMPDGDCLYGYGLLSKGLPILQYANFIWNMRADELKLKMYGSYKYWDDQVFNPYNVISQPGAMILMANAESVAGNLVPLNPHLEHIQISYEEVAALLAEFEEVTVPKVVKGMVDQEDVTATSTSLAHSGASGKMNVQAYHINDRLLQPALERMYALIYEKVEQNDPDVLMEIARLTQDVIKMVPIPQQGIDPQTGQPLPPIPTPMQKSPEELLAGLPKFLPLPEIDIKVVAYQNFIRKQQTLQNINAFVTQVAATPAGRYIKWYQMAQAAGRLMELPLDQVLMNDDEMKQADQQAQQQQQQQTQMETGAQALTIQLEYMKEQNRHAEQMLKAQLEQNKMVLEAERTAAMESKPDKAAT